MANSCDLTHFKKIPFKMIFVLTIIEKNLKGESDFENSGQNEKGAIWKPQCPGFFIARFEAKTW